MNSKHIRRIVVMPDGSQVSFAREDVFLRDLSDLVGQGQSIKHFNWESDSQTLWVSFHTEPATKG